MDATSNKENAAAPVPEGFREMLNSLSPEQLAGLGLVQEGGTAAAGSASGSPSGEQPPKRSKSDAVPVAASPPPHGPAPSAVVAPSPAAREPPTEGTIVVYQAPPPPSSALTGGGTLAVVPRQPRGHAHAHEPSSAAAAAAAAASIGAASIGADAAGTADLTAAGLEQHLSALPDDRARIAHLRTLDLDTMEGSSKATKALRKAYLFNLLSLMAKVRRPVSVASGSSGPAPLLPACTAPTPTRRASHLHHRCSTPTPGRLERQ